MHPSPRVVGIPVYDPVYYDTGKLNGRTADLKVANYLGFFIERRQGNNVYGRITPIGGLIKGPATARRRRARSRKPFVSWSSSPWPNLQRSSSRTTMNFDDIGRLLRASGVPIGVMEGARRAPSRRRRRRHRRHPRRRGLRDGAIERLRAAHTTTAIFAVAHTTDPELILQAMRAGANEFFMWPVPEDSFEGAVRRMATRRDTANASAKPPSGRSSSSAPRAARGRRPSA